MHARLVRALVLPAAVVVSTLTAILPTSAGAAEGELQGANLSPGFAYSSPFEDLKLKP